MTDKEKFLSLFKEVGLGCMETSDGIAIDLFEIDGCTHEVFIKFCECGKYQEIVVYSDPYTEEDEENDYSRSNRRT